MNDFFGVNALYRGELSPDPFSLGFLGFLGFGLGLEEDAMFNIIRAQR